MADDKSNTGRQDRIRVASGQEYEVRDFADKFYFARPGNRPHRAFRQCRETLEQEARKLNG
jgi:hypothetical protein